MPMAVSVCPVRHARPRVSLMITPTLTSRRAAMPGPQVAARRRRDRPAAARSCPERCWRRPPRRPPAPGRAGSGHDPGRAAPGHVRTASASMAASRSPGHHPALGLADDLGGDDQDVAVPQAGRRGGDERGQVGAGLISGRPVTGRTVSSPGPGGCGHRASSAARSRAARAICAVAARSVMYSGSARTAMPVSSGAVGRGLVPVVDQPAVRAARHRSARPRPAAVVATPMAVRQASAMPCTGASPMMGETPTTVLAATACGYLRDGKDRADADHRVRWRQQHEVGRLDGGQHTRRRPAVSAPKATICWAGTAARSRTHHSWKCTERGPDPSSITTWVSTRSSVIGRRITPGCHRSHSRRSPPTGERRR